MSVVVYEMEHSPYCIPITEALTALGVSFERVGIANWDRSKIIEITDGQYYQVPLLQHDEKVIFERGDQSLDVARYVDTFFANGRLFPAETSGLQEIIVAHIENELEGLTFKLCDIHYLPAIKDAVGRVMSIRHKERRFGRGCVDSWRENRHVLKADLERLLERFDRTLRSRAFLMGDCPLYVDYALSGVIGNYTYRDYNALNPEHSGLHEWYRRLRDYRFSRS